MSLNEIIDSYIVLDEKWVKSKEKHCEDGWCLYWKPKSVIWYNKSCVSGLVDVYGDVCVAINNNAVNFLLFNTIRKNFCKIFNNL